MAKNIPVLLWNVATSFGGNSSVVSVDTTIDGTWVVGVGGTDSNGKAVKAKYVIIDNTGNNASCYTEYGNFRYSVAPFTRKTFPILDEQNYLKVIGSINVITCIFTDFDPGIPDDVNQVASSAVAGGGSGGGGGGGSSGTVTFTTDVSLGLTISGAGLTVTINDQTIGTSGWKTAFGNITIASGKKYFEATPVTSGAYNFGIGFGGVGAIVNNYIGAVDGYMLQAGTGLFYLNAFSSSGPVFENNDTACIAFDATAELVWFGIGSLGLWNDSPTANPATGVGGINVASVVGPFRPGISLNSPNGGYANANFGQMPYVRTVPSGFTNC